MRPYYFRLSSASMSQMPWKIDGLQEERLPTPLPLRHLGLYPPRGSGNAAALDRESLHGFARRTAEYVTTVCGRLNLVPERIGIDAPSTPCAPELSRRRAEVALDMAGISCFATPTAAHFELIRKKVFTHLTAGGAEDRIPHSNQLWMLAGFQIFVELSRVASCIEVFPQSIVRAVGSGQIHKSQPGPAEAQLRSVARHSGWPLGLENEPDLRDIAQGSSSS